MSITLEEHEQMHKEAHDYFTTVDAGKMISEYGLINFLERVQYSVENPVESELVEDVLDYLIIKRRRL